MRHAVARMVEIGPRGRQLIVEAAAQLALARAALLLLPFRRVAGRHGEFIAPEIAPPVSTTSDEAEAARAVGWAVRAAAKRVPFKATCLPQALAARAMLRRRRFEVPIHFGAGRDEAGELTAHAWVDLGGMGVTGRPLPPGLRELGRFVSKRFSSRD